MKKKNQQKSNQPIRRLMNVLADSMIGSPNSEFIKELRSSGSTVEREAECVRSLFAKTQEQHRLGRIRNSEEEFRDQMKQITGRPYELPSTASGRRSLLLELFGNHQLQPRQVAAWSGKPIKELSDTDVDKILKNFVTVEKQTKKRPNKSRKKSGK